MSEPGGDDEVRAAPGERVDKPWGHELRWAVTDRYIGKLIHVKKGHQLSLQYHVQKDETIFIVSGLLDLVLEDAAGELNVHRMTPGMTARVRPGRRHRFIGVEDTDLFEVSSPEVDDVVRLEDSYGRAGSSTA
jgi:mannose-6-phosphate isomerase